MTLKEIAERVRGECAEDYFLNAGEPPRAAQAQVSALEKLAVRVENLEANEKYRRDRLFDIKHEYAVLAQRIADLEAALEAVKKTIKGHDDQLAVMQAGGSVL